MIEKFNEAQLSAINADNRKILVSAGAGAGKSGTLTERIVNLIETGKADLLQMLVITFTKDAAASIRQKIRDSLTEKAKADTSNLRLNESAQSMPASHISTIHSFCSDIVRQGAAYLGIDSAFTILDEGLRKKYFEQALSNAVEELGKKTYPKDRKSYFGALKQAININQMKKLCLEVYDVLMGIPNPFDRLNNIAEELSASPNPWEKELYRYHRLVLLSNRKTLEDLKILHDDPSFPEAYLAVCEADIKALTAFLTEVEASKTTADLISAVQTTVDSITAIRKKGTMTEAQAAVYEQFKRAHGHLKNQPSSPDNTTLLASKNELDKINACKKTDILKTQKQMIGLKVLLEETHNQFTAIKANESVLDYADLEQYAYELLTSKEISEIRDYVRSTFKYVFVDECQDVSAIQYAIINAMDSGENNFFFVGDIKQSIYRFRHADPLQFLDMRNRFSESPAAECRKIYFQHNYRSSASIIDGVNLIFSNLFDKAYTEIDYEPGDHLLVGTDKDRLPEFPNEIILINDDADPDDPDAPEVNPLEAQCAEIGDCIKDLIKSGMEFKDIVILNRSVNAVGQKIVDYMTAMHIPCYFNGKSAYFDTPEVSLFIEILKTVNNDYMDYPLLATLRSDLFGFADAELAEIRILHPDRKESFSSAFHSCADDTDTALGKHCRQALDTIRKWQKEAAEIHKTSDVIWNMLKKTNYYARQSAFPDGEIRQKNLDALYDKALTYERLGNYKLCDFLDQIDVLRKAKGGSQEPVPMTDNDNFVRVMSIHASKGLEFPVVFLMDMQKNIHRGGNAGFQINIETESPDNPSLGIYMPCMNIVGKFKTSHDTYGKYAFKAKRIMRDIAEESRLLYVGMTRAMQRLYMTGIVKGKSLGLWNVNDKAYRALNLRSMLDMVMPTVLGGTPVDHIGDIMRTPLWNVSFVEPRTVKSDAAVTGKVDYPDIKNDIDFDKEWSKISESKTDLPAKTAVSYILDESFIKIDEDTIDKDETETVNAISLHEEQEKPEFIVGKASAPESAELGTLAHKLMRLLPLDELEGKDKKHLCENISEFVRNAKYFSDKQSEKLIKEFTGGIADFLLSSLGNDICRHADHVFREQDFVFRTEVGGYSVLVQGVIDLLFKDGDGKWVIVDYKTDHNTTPDALIEKHSEQLNYYRHAIEKINKEPVSRIYVVALRTGSVVEISARPVKYA